MKPVVLITIDGVRLQDFQKRFGHLIKLGFFFTNLYVENPVKISYPGYNELLTGIVDPNLTTNNEVNNWNPTIVERLVDKKILDKSEVLISTSWSKFIDIYGYIRSGLKPINWRYNLDSKMVKTRPNLKYKISFPHYHFKGINKSDSETVQHDILVYQQFLRNWNSNKKYGHIGLLLTDLWAHTGKFNQYINHLKLAGDIIMDFIKKYGKETTIIITTDHGRGVGDSWISHKKTILGSEKSWCLVINSDKLPANIRYKKALPLSIIAYLILICFKQ